mmetsp:Transcript_3050/g.7156  ORF Transcript_3050/g.7156 Transcript_3050/m.7156 type:complete len:109 (+) Transcript_3050:40-366(+)
MVDKSIDIDKQHNEEPKEEVATDLNFGGSLRDSSGGLRDSCGSLRDGSQKRRSLAQALDNSSNYFFDMSDRWRDAFLDSLQDPIDPAPEKFDLLQEMRKVQSILLSPS